MKRRGRLGAELHEQILPAGLPEKDGDDRRAVDDHTPSRRYPKDRLALPPGHSLSEWPPWNLRPDLLLARQGCHLGCQLFGFQILDVESHVGASFGTR